MKGLFIIMILLLLGNWSSFSQIGTPADTLVHLPKWRALKAAQDLIRYDALIVVDSLQREKIKELEKVITVKDERIVERDLIISRQNLMLNNNAAVKKEMDQQIKQSEKKVRNQKTLKWVVIVGFVASLFIK